jgi:transposase-like protein
MESEEFKQLQKKALEQLQTGQSLTGKDGVFAPLLKQFIESALEAEMHGHLDDLARKTGNKRNGKKSKTLKTSSGEIDISTPQDRHSNFDPQLVKKRQTVLADNLAPKIIGLYGLGMSFRDIQSHILEMYDVDLSATTLSDITDRVIPQVKAWQSRQLDSLYVIVWLDAMHYKVREDGRVKSRAVYNILAINAQGHKELIGMYVSESEGARFWLSVLTDLKQRGVEDILIASIDNLKGFSEAINSIFPQAEVQSCIVHQVRNSLKYVASKDQKAFMKDLKRVYQAATKMQAEAQLTKLDEVWGQKYPVVIKSWQTHWDKLTTYFEYDDHIRRLIYTTNAVEGFHRQIRKVTKTKGAFPSDMALMKLIYLAVQNISKKWTHPIQNWALIVQQLAIRFGDRFILSL